MTRLLRALLLSLLFASPAFATTFSVNDLGDASDANPGDNVCATAGNVCTLRAAIEEANAHAGSDTIVFSVAGTIAPAAALPDITETLVIDGTSAPGYTTAPVVRLSGGGTVGVGLSFAAGSDNSQLTALKVDGFTASGVSVASANVTIARCYLGPVGGGAANRDGLFVTSAADTTLVDRNVVSGNTRYGIRLTGVNHLLTGNYVGLDAAGSAVLANGSDGVHIFGDTLNIRIGSAASPNVISGNGGDGVYGEDSVGSITIAGDLIGTDAAGTTTLGNGGNGVHFVNCSNDAIGAAGATTRIFGSSGDGIFLEGDTVSNTVASCTIDKNGTGIADLGTGNIVQQNTISANVGNGLTLQGVNASVTGNTISSNGGAGVSVLGTATGNTIVTNTIVSNTGLGIDLGGDGVTDNDPGDGDSGPNQLQNFPVVTAAVTTGTQSTIQGTIDTTPSTSATIHFYANTTADPSNHGEGETYLGTTIVMTDGSGSAAFSFTGPALTVGQFVSATATTADGTSEFALNVTVAAAPSIQFSTSTYSVSEGAGNATITVTRSGDLTATSTVNYATSDGTATAPADYTATSGTLTFGPGVATQTFNVPIVDDALSEASETVNLTLSSPTAATLGAPSTATLTIVDNDPLPSLAIDDVSQAEGNSGTTAFTFHVTLSVPSGQTVTVAYATANGTATAGSDYTATSGTLTFTAGVTSQTITVNVNGDVTTEPNETFFVNLSNATNATISDNQGQGTIVNDDAPGLLTINDVTHAEGNAGTTAFTFTVTLSTPNGSTVTVDYATANGTATAGSDYTAASGTLTFAPGVTSQTITVNVNGDTTFEPDETFFVNLSNATNATIADNQAVGTIQNDDSLGVLTINDVAHAEGNAGTTAFTFTVSLAAPSANTVTVDYATANGTATAGSDYTATSGILTFAPGVTSQTITVNVTGDTTFEPDETFFVNLSNATNATIADNQGLGTIQNDDAAVGAQIPTLSEWALAALALAFMAIAAMKLR